MGKKVIVIAVLAIVLAVSFLAFRPEQKLLSLSQVTGCFDGVCGGSDGSFGQYEIDISSEIGDELNRLYSESGSKEFVLCLKGNKFMKSYSIEGLETPDYIDSKDGGITYNYCEDSIGTLHNHYNPSNDDYYCQFSARDIYAFGQGNDDVMGIICGNSRYVFMHKSDLMPMEVLIK